MVENNKNDRLSGHNLLLKRITLKFIYEVFMKAE